MEETGLRIAIVGPASPRDLLLERYDKCSIPVGMGGIPVNDLTRALLIEGHEVVVITGSPDLEKPWRHSEGRLEVRAVPYRVRARARALSLFRRERRFLAREILAADVDVVHAHWTYEFALAATAIKVPHVVSIHDAPLTILKHMKDPYRLIRAYMAYGVRFKAKALVAVSPYVASRWKREMLDPRSIPTIPNIIPDMYEWQADYSHTSTVIDVSNSTPLKNVEVLIDAIRELRIDHPHLDLMLIGPGLEEHGSFAAKQHERGPVDFVRFMGPVRREDIPKHISQSTVMCHPSLEESFGICALEAMAVGIPVVAARQAGGMRWLLSGGAGVLCDGREVSSIRSAISLLLDSPRRRLALVSSASAMLARDFNTTRIVKECLAAYEMAIAQQTRSNRHQHIRSDE